MLLINPGSKIGEQSSDQKWTNTHEVALEVALRYLKNIQNEGIKDIRMYDTKEEINGRWRFIFKHLITGVEVELETHGIEPMDEYIKEHIFSPRVYWDGSSCSAPELDQWLKDGYKKVLKIEKIDE